MHTESQHDSPYVFYSDVISIIVIKTQQNIIPAVV